MKKICNGHNYIMSCGGQITRITSKGLETKTIRGKGIYCLNCGYKPKRNEVPVVLKDFRKLINR